MKFGVADVWPIELDRLSATNAWRGHAGSPERIRGVAGQLPSVAAEEAAEAAGLRDF
jgi:hypothetical protein